jgi:hypothetical protein
LRKLFVLLFFLPYWDVVPIHSSRRLTGAADETAIRQTDDNWSKAAQSKKLDHWMAFYAGAPGVMLMAG